MKKTKNKILRVIILVQILVFTSTFGIILPVNAQDVDTYPYFSIFPNPIGIGQTAVASMWVQPLQPAESDIYHGFMVTITKPDGTIENLGPFDSDPTGGTYFTYIPNMVGVYNFQFSYPGETFSSSGEFYKPATSPITELVVQEEPLPPYPGEPLPTDYWDRPINAEHRDWWSISGNWLMNGYSPAYRSDIYDTGSGWNPYSEAPRTSHISWTRELLLGGLVGGEYDSTSYYTGQDYEAYATPPIIINGKLYYRIYASDFRTAIRPGIVCVDLRTGEELWRNTEINIDIGQLYDYRSGNQQGVVPWLWDIGENELFGSFRLPHTYKMYDSFTGDLIVSFENAIQGGVPVFGDDGTLYVYFIDGVNNWLAVWNSTQAFEANGLIAYGNSGVGALRPSQPWWLFANVKGTYDWNSGISWNVSIPDVPDYPDLNFGGFIGQDIKSVMGDVLFVTVESFSATYHEIGYNKNTGERLWIRDADEWTWKRAFGQQVYADFHSPSRTWTGYDVNTGTQLWQTEPQEYPWGLYGGANSIIAEDMLISPSYDGYVHTFDINTGQDVWKYYSEDTAETPYGTYPFYYGPIVADGVIFAGTSEHSPSQPLTRGLKLYAIESDTGEGIWSIAGMFAPQAIADGYLLASNGYDNKLYCFGKGPSETTVLVQDDVISLGESILIKGMITDNSAGTMQSRIKNLFPKGVPAIADENMSVWMEHLYMQKQLPEDVFGVPVELRVVHPGGSVEWITTVTSDVYGNYGYMYVPPTEGVYKIIATFAGSESYWSSSAESLIAVGPSSTPTTPIEPEEPTAPLISTELAIILAAVIIALAIIIGFWITKRRQ